MKEYRVVPVVGLMMLAGSLLAAEPALPAPVTEKPDAPFHQAVLNFALASGQKVTAYILFRGGQGSVEHVLGENGGQVSPIIPPGTQYGAGSPVSLWDVSGLRVAQDQLSGTLRYSPTAKGPEVVSLPVAAKIAADGTLQGSIGEQPLTGKLLSAEQLTQANAFAPGKDWPQYEGPTVNMRGPDTDRPYRQDLTRPRLVWMSEERFGAGRENRLDPFDGWTGPWTPMMGEGKIFFMIPRASADSPLDEEQGGHGKSQERRGAADAPGPGPVDQPGRTADPGDRQHRG